RQAGPGRCAGSIRQSLHLCGCGTFLFLSPRDAPRRARLRAADFGDFTGGILMALHFDRAEFDARRDRLVIEMSERKLDALLLFAQESMYWLTGYDTFGFCFFQCLVVK